MQKFVDKSYSPLYSVKCFATIHVSCLNISLLYFFVSKCSNIVLTAKTWSDVLLFSLKPIWFSIIRDDFLIWWSNLEWVALLKSFQKFKETEILLQSERSSLLIPDLCRGTKILPFHTARKCSEFQIKLNSFCRGFKNIYTSIPHF